MSAKGSNRRERDASVVWRLNCINKRFRRSRLIPLGRSQLAHYLHHVSHEIPLEEQLSIASSSGFIHDFSPTDILPRIAAGIVRRHDALLGSVDDASNNVYHIDVLRCCIPRHTFFLSSQFILTDGPTYF